MECDGEKFHSTDEQVQNDLERQAVLERLGFTFIRIRGSDFYRRREETIENLYKKLDKLKVIKGNEGADERAVKCEIDYHLLDSAKEIRAEIEIKLN